MPRFVTRALALVAGAAVSVNASERVILQYFETEWDDIERRAPDVFKAGYRALWVPPPSKASDPFSVGFDVFNRFNLGEPPLVDNSPGRARTAYGTESSFRAMVDELQRADVHIYIDTVLNHNSGRTTSDAFLADGGWPGFYIPREDPPRDKLPTDDWGDFHAGNAQGFLQSEDPGSPNYDLWRGDLVALIDIQQDRSISFIRQPVDPDDPENIPPGNIRNRPDPENARFYPDQVLDPDIFVNPPSSHSGSDLVIRYPFNLASPSRGDAVAEDSTGYLRRWLSWMLQVQGVDGFRLDASKHVFPWWWDTHFDSAVFQNRETPDGRLVTPLSFGENTTGNFDVLNNYYRKDAFANRDSLDLQGAARLRDLINAGGFGSWASLFANADNGHLDQADDGLQNGSAGIFHVFSHDNGAVGDGASLPPLPTERQQGWYAHAYMLMRPGLPIVYHNGRGIPRSFGFFPRAGIPSALGWDSAAQAPEDTITTLVGLHNTLARGDYFQRNGNISDILVFERSTNTGSGLLGNVLVAVSDRYDAGFDTLTVGSTFPQGTRLVEQTGNAADPDVDPTGQIPDVITVGANGAVSLAVPRNVSSTGEHNKGFVVYAPAPPEATLSIAGASGVIPPDPASFPDFIQRLTEIPIVSDDSFTLRLETVPGDTVDLTTDDNALFRIDAGVEDWNGSGGPDIPLTEDFLGGYEQFTDVSAPGMSDPDREGLYEQVIDATRLDEGFHYISAVAFRQRPAGSGPIFAEQREVVCIDRLDPEIVVEGADEPFTSPQPTLRFLAQDRTSEQIHPFVNLDQGQDPVDLIGPLTAARRFDRFVWTKTLDEPLDPGPNTLTVVVVETSGRNAVLEFELVFQPDCPADLAAPFGILDLADVNAFVAAFTAQDPAADLAAPFGTYDLADVNAFASSFVAGCP